MRLPDRNIAALLMIYRKINAWRSEHAAPLGLSSSQVTIIIETCKNSGISQTELVKRLSHEKSVVAKAIGKLIAAGYITREQIPRTSGRLTCFQRKRLRRSIPCWSNRGTSVWNG